MKIKNLIILSTVLSLLFTCSPKTGKVQMNSDNVPDNDPDVDIIQIDNSGNAATGTLDITITEGTRNGFDDIMGSKTVLPQIDMTRDAFKITATCSDGTGFTLTTKLTSIQILGMPVGRWRIQIESLNADKVSIGYGEDAAVIEESEATELTIEVLPYPGFGIMEITVNWEAGLQDPSITGSMSQSSGPSYNLEFEISGNSATALVTAAAGYYVLRLNLYDTAGGMNMYIGGAVEILRIVEDETTPGVFTITANSGYGYGDIEIGIIDDMKDPIDIVLSGQSAFIYASQTMTVQASSPGETESIEYTWYLNGEPVAAGDTFTTGPDLPIGPYRLDVTAFNVSGDRGGSVTYFFEVRIVQPSNLSYSQNPALYTAGLQIQDNTASVTGSGISFAVVPELPQGLTLDANTGTISGTPVYAQDATIYTVYASNSSGYTSVDLSITISAVVPVLAVAGFDSDHVDLSWTYDFPNIGGYELYRSTTSGIYDYDVPLTVISTTEGSYSYTDNSVESGTIYYYIARAFYGLIFSGNSNEVSATAISGIEEYLAAHWWLNGNLNDSAGASNGTAYGSPAPVYVAGAKGLPDTAIQLSAAYSNYVNFGTGKFGMDTTSEFTVAFWLRLDSNTFNTIIAKGQYVFPFWIYRYTSSPIRLTWCVRTSNTFYNYTNQAFTIGQWYHIAIEFGDGYTKLYVNGVLDKSVALTGNLTLGTSGYPLVLGGGSWSSTYSDISIGDLRIYNACLTGDEILGLYSSL